VAQVIWRPPATEHLREIYETIAKDNRQAARRVIEELVDAAERLSFFPLSGRTLPENDEWREVVKGNYRIVYKLDGENAVIALVQHAKRLMPADLE
jgi:addiction module RelE/StbE family toxin